MGTKGKYLYPVFLMGIFILLVGLSWPSGRLYGSDTDWFSQHVNLAETIRDACLEQKTLAPAFLPLGGGSNGFMFSYYGYFRPDITLGCLFPQVPMVWLVTGYSLLTYLASVFLCYVWLNKNGQNRGAAFLGSLLFMTAGCFFHIHRQIMFINYMPFLLLALLAVRKKKTVWVPACLFLIFIHSFYYSIACLAVVGWYWYEQQGRRFWKDYLKTTVLSVGMAAVLLIPTGLVILENKRLAEGGGALKALLVNPRMSSLLYSAYGIGLTAICFYCLLIGLSSRKFRKNSIIFLVLTFWMFASYLLNGTLYARAKILVPFLPLIILHTVKVMQALYRKEIKVQAWPFLVMGICMLCHLGQKTFLWMGADLLILGVFLFFLHRGKAVWHAGVLVFLFPAAMFLFTAGRESYTEAVESDKTLDKFEFSTAYADGDHMIPGYRTEDLTEPLNGSNALIFEGQQKSSMYSSISNPDYADVYYNLLKTPIRINNRIALLPSVNPFLQQLMGMRYLLTTKDWIPGGYEAVWEKEGYVLAENPQVLPMAYTTEETMSEAQFEGLDELKQLEAITRYTIVPEGGWKDWEAGMQACEPVWETPKLPESVRVERRGAEYELWVEEDVQFELNLKEPLKGQILLVQFEVDEQKGRAVTIQISGIRNKVSADTAAYPNGNSTFHFQIYEGEGESIQKLQVKLSKGNYKINNLDFRTLDGHYLTEKAVSPAQFAKSDKGEILACRVENREDTYFVTSIPLQNGMKLFVDGRERDMEKVNGAFAGCPLEAGNHEIKMVFSPPGYKAGLILTGLSTGLYLVWVGILCFRHKKTSVYRDKPGC